jgi:hypothetical protein
MEQERNSGLQGQENQYDSNKSGDKDSPQASGGTSGLGSTEQSVKKEAGEPGGGQNAAGADENASESHESKIGSQPIPSDQIDKGD